MHRFGQFTRQLCSFVSASWIFINTFEITLQNGIRSGNATKKHAFSKELHGSWGMVAFSGGSRSVRVASSEILLIYHFQMETKERNKTWFLLNIHTIHTVTHLSNPSFEGDLRIIFDHMNFWKTRFPKILFLSQTILQKMRIKTLIFHCKFKLFLIEIQKMDFYYKLNTNLIETNHNEG